MDLHGLMVVPDVGGEDPGRCPWPVPATESVANLPIARHVLDALVSAGARRIVVAASERCAAAVRACLDPREAPVPVHFLERPGPMTLGAALGLAAPVVGDAPCLVHAADGLLAEPATPLIDALDGGVDAVLVVHQASGADERLSEEAAGALGVAELDPARTGLGLAGVCALRGGALARATRSGTGDPADLAGVAQRLAAAGAVVQLRMAQGWRRYRGDCEDLLELNRIALDRLEGRGPCASADGNRVEGRVVIHGQASVRASVLVGPLVIGAGAQIADAYIGPYTAIGAGARIEGAEVERSIIAPGVSIIHVGHRLTDSVVGRDARVVRDFSLPRAMRLSVGPETEISLC